MADEIKSRGATGTNGCVDESTLEEILARIKQVKKKLG
jgi:hypothetical protein